MLFKKRRLTPGKIILAAIVLMALNFGPGFLSAQEETAPVQDTPQTAYDERTVDIAEELHGEEQHATGEAETGHGSGHFVRILFELIFFIVAAKIGGELMERIHQPAVLGELILGVVLGNLALVGLTYFDFLKTAEFIQILAEIGVLILLFEVGLETDLKEMLSVGMTSFLVAMAGVIAPFILGWGVAVIFLPDVSTYVHVFVGATLAATSVGITARVIKDIKKLQTKEAKIILGAAVIDDIMGLVILAIVTGLISAANTGESVNSLSVLLIVVKAVAFIVLAIVIGNKLMPRIFLAALTLRTQGMLLVVALLVLFSLSAIAQLIGLAGIVGAFAAGVIMEKVHYAKFTERGEHPLEDLFYPLSTFLVPIFFVHMGLMVDLSTFGNPTILVFAGVLSLAAIVGKQACSLAVLEKGLNKISIGIGMIPRGEVGLIFAKIGHGLMIAGVPVVSDSTYSAVVIMVIITTLITPPILKRSLIRKSTDFYGEA